MRVNETIRVDAHEDKEHPVTSGAYIEVFERHGKVGARMSFYDSDMLRGAEELKAFHRTLGAAIEIIETHEGPLPPLDITKDPTTLEMLQDMLGLVTVEEGMPSMDMLHKLTQEQREEVADWCGDCHFEASDNPVVAGPMPACLRDQLPDDHFYKQWRTK